MDEKKTYLLRKLLVIQHMVFQKENREEDFDMPYHKVDSIPIRLRLFKTLIYIHNFNKELAKTLLKAQKDIIINVDQDIDYDLWTSEDSWLLNDDTFSFWGATDDGFDFTDANCIAGYFPSAPKNSHFDDDGARNTIREALKVLSGPFLNYRAFEVAIKSALREMTSLLVRLQNALHRKRDPQEYYRLATELFFTYNARYQGSIEKTYKIRRDKLEDLSIEWLEERLSDTLITLYNSDFMQKVMEDIPLKKASKAKILYALKDISTDDQKCFYHALSHFCTYNNGIFDFSEGVGNIGSTIYHRQTDFRNNEYEAFFEFQIQASLIANDLAPLLANQPPQPKSKVKKSMPEPDHDFMTFKLHGINTGHITLLYQKMMDFNWIPKDTDADDFQLLFSGKSCVCKIVWTGGGLDNLYELFNQIRNQHLITIPGNAGLETVLSNHFTDEDNQYLDVHYSGKPSTKMLPKIIECIKILQTHFNLTNDDYDE